MGDVEELKIYDFRMNREGELIKKPFIVATPRPYVIDLEGASDELGLKISLMRDVEFLRDIIKRLIITEVVAYEMKLTLNIDTGEKLRGIAYSRGDKDAIRMIDEHKW